MDWYRKSRYNKSRSTYDRFDDEQKETVERLRFGSTLKLKGIDVDKETFILLIRNFDVDWRVFNEHDYSMEVYLSDVKYAFGLSSHGTNIEIGKHGEVTNLELEKELNMDVTNGEIGLDELGQSMFKS
ncbi:hypothetical protein ACH5RR_026332 [Cinchona calisaya]|uniref:Uncharacterized protein n=1 Tax=Cinchona calisaya TaxID=153742 RepID=A0ABD2Z5N9_9GENT